MRAFVTFIFLISIVMGLEAPDGDYSLTRLKRQASPLTQAWNEALPGVQPFWLN
jgi:hypothetical protein